MLENYKKIPVKTIYMEMLEKPVFNFEIPENITFLKINIVDIEEYKSIYKKAGDTWGWSGRLIMSDTELKNTLSSYKDEVYFMKINKKVAGFFELNRHNDTDVELVYMGLFDDYIGKGYGKILLNFIKKVAWNYEAKRFWLHTCEFDHINAIKNYEKAGFSIYDEKTEEEYYPIEFLKKHKK